LNPPTSSLQGRVALVTGASAGIGWETCKALAAAGMRIVGCARREERLEALAAELGAQGVADTDVLMVPADLRDEAAILNVFAQAKARFGGVDVLVNNAGLGREAPLMSGATEHWREMLELNVLALCVCTREAVQDMTRRKVAGHIIHVASMASHRVPAGSGVYSATKYAVRSLTEGLRLELRQAKSPIRVTAVSPGFVETEFAYVYTHGDEDRARATYDRFKVLTAQDVANAVVYAVSQPPHVQIHDILMRPTDQPS